MMSGTLGIRKMPSIPDTLFYDLPEAACIVEVDSLLIVGWNRKMDQLFGLSADSSGAVRLLDRVQAWNADHFQAKLAQHEFESPEFRGITGLTVGGHPAQLDLLITCSTWERQPAYLMVFSDAGPRVRLEEQLRQAQKMETVGMLAGGIAHDFNNLLTIISGYSHMLASSLASDEKNRFAAEQVIKASDRAAALTKQLLSFSRRQVTQARVLDMNSVVQGMSPMLNRLIGEHIRLRIVPAPELGRVRADSGQIEQVIMNLVVNARDAMPEGGTLWIETLNTELDAQYMSRHMEARPGPYIMLVVTDSGVGMDAATREKIFEPFFTTKGEGRGTGLGLSMVYGIVKRSGGTIDVYSEPGQGTAVKIYLPRADSQESPAAPELHAAPDSGDETVLLVEDEEAVRNIVRTALEAKGYRMLVAASGEDALQLAKDHSGSIDLLITDVVLPKMNGREVARRLHKKRANAVVLFMSGYTDVTLNDGADPESQVHFIGKPFTPAVLTRKVRELLDAERQRGTKSHNRPLKSRVPSFQALPDQREN